MAKLSPSKSTSLAISNETHNSESPTTGRIVQKPFQKSTVPVENIRHAVKVVSSGRKINYPPTP